MNVAVITRHAVSNYGSLLQALATQKIIEKLGHKCEIIDYIRDDENYKNRELTNLKLKPEWYNNPIKRIIYLALRQPESIIAGRKFDKVQKNYLNLTKRYASPEQLASDKPQADIYMTGSDQVWGPMGNGDNDSSYCLSFTDDNDKRIAYAASFGHSDMTESKREYFGKWLSRYADITVREDKAIEMLNELGIAAKQVLDPTLLIDGDEWSSYAEPIKQQKYVLVYQLHNDKKLGEYAKTVAEKKGLPLIRISASLHQIPRPGKFIGVPSIGEFLSYIKNAECMITDSFHGTAFAINFNTPFVEVLPNNNTGSRNVSILKLTGLSGRIIKDINNTALADEKIDFSEVNRIIEKKRIESIGILKTMLDME